MGAWGTGAFENDDASDWVYELESKGLAAVDHALSTASASSYLELPEGANVVAAGEVIAAALGHPVAGLRSDILGLANNLAGSITPGHAERASRAIDQVLASSEVADLWAESPDGPAWRQAVEDLRRRLVS